MSLEGTLLGAELVASHLSHSLIILTDAYHTLYNIISVFLLVISFKVNHSMRTNFLILFDNFTIIASIC